MSYYLRQFAGSDKRHAENMCGMIKQIFSDTKKMGITHIGTGI
jgi:hypothetical protein